MTELTDNQKQELQAIEDMVDNNFALFDSAMAVATKDKLLSEHELAHICSVAQVGVRGIFPNHRVTVLPYYPIQEDFVGYSLSVWWKGGVNKKKNYTFRLTDYGTGVETE